MNKVIVKVTYQVEDTDEDIKTAEEIEIQRWQMFQQKYNISPLELEVKESK